MLPGNHETHDDTRAFCERFGFVDFHRQVRGCSRHGEFTWAGLGYSNITPFNTPGEYSEEEISRALSAFDGIDPLYLVVHFPPHGTKLDEYAPGKHAGSPALREWVERARSRRIFSAATSTKPPASPTVSEPRNASTSESRAMRWKFEETGLRVVTSSLTG